jgi:hypothetical protein
LQLVPRFTDETEDMQFALEIAREGLRPLVSNDSYNGPLFHYLLAAGFAAGGGPAWPRVLALVLGSLTVAVTYLLGMAVARTVRPEATAGQARAAGAVAGLMMATGFVPVIVSSHVAWSNSTTPLWLAAFFGVVVEAVRRDRPRLLLVAGFAAGLAQQTHPSALVYLAAGGIWCAAVRPRWLRTRWPASALAVTLLCTANLTAYNLLTRGGSLELIRERDYAFTGGASAAEYAGNARQLLRLTAQMVGSAFVGSIDETADPEALRRVMLAPATLAALAAAGAGVAYTARRAGLAFTALAVLVAAMPAVNKAYHHYLLARYLAPLGPLLAASTGAWLATGLAPAGRRLGAAGALALSASLVAPPLGRIAAFYTDQLASGKTNARVWQVVEAMAGEAARGELVGIDRGLRHVRLTGGGNLANVPDGLLDVLGAPHERVREKELACLPRGFVLLLSREQRGALEEKVALEAVPLGSAPAPASPDQYDLVRIGPRR